MPSANFKKALSRLRMTLSGSSVVAAAI